jgi:predicted amidophosphoribosyltransferase
MLQHIIDFIFPPQCGGCEEPGTGACDSCVPRNAIVCTRLRTLEVTALAAYEGNARRAIVALKSGRRDVAETFAARLAEVVPAKAALVPVPTTPARRRERGFDGCILMARLIGDLTGVAVWPGLVQTRGDRQRGRDRHARLSAHGRFAWRGQRIEDMELVLLDDVVTTGATLEDCAATLRACGASVEQAIVIARA